MLDYLLSYGIEFEDGGAPAKLRKIATAAKSASTAFAELQKQTTGLVSALEELNGVAAQAGASVSGLAAAYSATASEGARAGSGARSAAGGFNATAAAANRAASSVMRLNFAMMSGGGGGLGSSAERAGYAFPAALATRNSSTMRNVTPGGGGWVSPYFAGRSGVGGGGGGGGFGGATAEYTFRRGGGGGGRGPGGGGGGWGGSGGSGAWAEYVPGAGGLPGMALHAAISE